MGGAISLLIVNFVIAQLFTAAFLVTAAKSRSRQAAQYCAAGFAVASLAAVFETVVPFTSFPRFFAISAFATMLAGFCLLRFGLGLFYRVPASWQVLVAFFLASVALDLVIYPMQRGTLQHAVLYQLPFFIIQAWSATAVWRSRRRSAADWILLSLLVLTAGYCALKVYIAVAAGSGTTAQDYVSSPFALVSQALGAMLIVGTGLAMLGVMIKDIVDDARARSEIDLLSELYNRRGFIERVTPMLQPGRPAGTLILADLDRFKQVNDSYGHHTGDEVIRQFARVLSEIMPNRAVAGRLGGEEFAVFLPSTDLEEARVVAHGMRAAMMSQKIDGLAEQARITASFGVAAIAEGEPLEQAMQRADKALYAAKENGRNRVECADAPQTVVNPLVPQWIGRP